MTCVEDRVMGSSARSVVPLVWLLLVPACAGTGPGGGGSPELERSRVILLHDHDTHLHDNHRDEVRRFVEGVRGAAPSVFLVSGNHELQPHEMVAREILDAARFPILAANIRIETEQLPRHPAYYILTTEDGLTLAVLGLSVINFEAPPGLVEEGYHQTVEAHRALAEEHDALILLNHIGIRYDLELANAFPDVAEDLVWVFGGTYDTIWMLGMWFLTRTS